MQLRRACEVLSQAHAAGEMVEFWKAVGYIEQALAQLRTTEMTEYAPPVSRFALKRLWVNGRVVWEIRENERLLTATDDAGIHQLAGEVQAAELRRQGI